MLPLWEIYIFYNSFFVVVNHYFDSSTLLLKNCRFEKSHNFIHFRFFYAKGYYRLHMIFSTSQIRWNFLCERLTNYSNSKKAGKILMSANLLAITWFGTYSFSLKEINQSVIFPEEFLRALLQLRKLYGRMVLRIHPPFLCSTRWRQKITSEDSETELIIV